jgi:hypothetical protein
MNTNFVGIRSLCLKILTRQIRQQDVFVSLINLAKAAALYSIVGGAAVIMGMALGRLSFKLSIFALGL